MWKPSVARCSSCSISAMELLHWAMYEAMVALEPTAWSVPQLVAILNANCMPSSDH